MLDLIALVVGEMNKVPGFSDPGGGEGGSPDSLLSFEDLDDGRDFDDARSGKQPNLT